MRQAYQQLFAASPDLNCRVLSRLVQGRFVVDRELVTGLRRGTDVRAIAIYEVRDGLIQNVWFLPND
jgi:hypothetical protein